MQVANRLQGIGEYYFSKKLAEIEQLRQSGKSIINLGIGSPDMPPHTSVVDELHKWSQEKNTHSYQGYKGHPIFRKSIANFYKKFYQVELQPDQEILPLIGSKEGIMHICMTYLNQGDGVLIPNPGYPTYASAVKLAGGTPIFYSLPYALEGAPDFNELEQLVENNSSIKLLFISYPHMPTGWKGSLALMSDWVSFAKKHQLLLVHDNPYSFILNPEPISVLSVPGALDCALELNSLSKSHNMAGWRIGMLCGKSDRIAEVLTFKSNMDSGMFLPAQMAAVKALELERDWFESINQVYAARKSKAFQLLDTIGCEYHPQQVGMFVWAKVPEKYTDGYQLSDELLHKAGVFITPGGIFGTEGNHYVRISLCSSESVLQESISLIQLVLQ